MILSPYGAHRALTTAADAMPHDTAGDIAADALLDRADEELRRAILIPAAEDGAQAEKARLLADLVERRGAVGDRYLLALVDSIRADLIEGRRRKEVALDTWLRQG